jgi:CRISP-associated protein Cas1
MPTAIVNQSGCHLHLKSERLEVIGLNSVSGREEVLREIPLRDLERLVILESVQITSHALAALLRAGIPVQILGWNGQYLGGFLPPMNDHGLARLRQYRAASNPAFALQLAGRIITAKTYNQRRVIQRLGLSRAATEDASEPAPSRAAPSPEQVRVDLDWMESLMASLPCCRDLDELRGYEGTATARYFQAWGGFLPPEFPFERRSKRPPLNPVNACISFGATLIYSETTAFIQAHGLDPALGLLHATEDGRWSLALDLMEPFRPVLVEALTLDLFSHQVLNRNHFESRNGGIYLNEDGRKKFFLQYERRMERQFLSESACHRTSLRQQLEQQAVMFKAALEDQAKFEPFLMN